MSVDDLLGRHVAVLGSTGQGKSCFTASVLQQLEKAQSSRIVVFDVNGEYAAAFPGCEQNAEKSNVKVTRLGKRAGGERIPYPALGRAGLTRMLKPSERTQRPALAFAIDALPFVESHVDGGVSLVGHGNGAMFDDCREDSAKSANDAVVALRSHGSQKTNASKWPQMKALGALVADSYCIEPGSRGGYQRKAFSYGHVAPLIKRIQRLTEDERFTDVVDVDPGEAATSGRGNDGDAPSEPLSIDAEMNRYVERIFGSADPDAKRRWNVHIVDLSNVAPDLLPLILGSLLESFSHYRFTRSNRFPTLLVLEEAHNYLRTLSTDDEDDESGAAYERLAKEGRKFGVSLWVSTQRPSELSPTVLAQCGTWVVLRLTAGRDIRSVAAAAEWGDTGISATVAGLARQEAVVFGAATNFPIHLRLPHVENRPNSADPEFHRWWVSEDDGACPSQ